MAKPLSACLAIDSTRVITTRHRKRLSSPLSAVPLHTLTTPQLGAVAPVGGTSNGENPRRAKSSRRPSATLAFVLMTQLQFLATLSLVDYTVTEERWLADFVTGLRCDGQRLFCHPIVFLFAVSKNLHMVVSTPPTFLPLVHHVTRARSAPRFRSR